MEQGTPLYVQGKSALEVIRDNTEFLLALPWNGAIGLFKIRMLNAAQIRACGNFTTLRFDEDERKKEITLDEIVEIKNVHEKLIRSALVSPTLDEIYEILHASDKHKEIQESIKRIKENIRTLKTMEEVEEEEKELEYCEIQLNYMLPEDFTGALVSIILQRDNTDIRKVTKDMLFEWAVLAERGNNNPADHVGGGIFTDFQKEEINKYAWIELNEYREREKSVNSGNKRWIRGTHKKR